MQQDFVGNHHRCSEQT